MLGSIVKVEGQGLGRQYYHRNEAISFMSQESYIKREIDCGPKWILCVPLQKIAEIWPSSWLSMI